VAVRPGLSRRDFFSRFNGGVHGAALAALLKADLLSAATHAPQSYDLRPRPPQIPAKAKAVIHLFQNGGPSHLDLFDPKPALQKFAGTAPGRDILTEIEFADQVGGMLPSPFQFKRNGRCGMELSELLPHLGTCADDITLIRSAYGEHFNHEPALFLMHSGRTLPGRRIFRRTWSSMTPRIFRSMASRAGSRDGFLQFIRGRASVQKDRLC
jgi:hypothetical protein